MIFSNTACALPCTMAASMLIGTKINRYYFLLQVLYPQLHIDLVIFQGYT